MGLIKKAKTGILAILLSAIAFTGKAQDINEANALYNEGVELAGQEKLDEALDKFIKVVEICESLEDESAIATKMTAEGVIPGVQFKIASNFLTASDFENGIPALEKTIEMADTYNDATTKGKAEEKLSQVYFYYANKLLQENKFEEAVVNFDKALSIDPDIAGIYYAKSVIYRQQNKPEEFKANLDKAIEVAKNTNDRNILNRALKLGWQHYYKAGYDAFSKNEFNECIENINASLEYNNNQTDAFIMLVQAYGKKQDWNNAIEIANKALEVESNDAEKKAGIYYEMANAYKEKGDNSSACECYKNAMHGKYVENAKYQREHILKCTN